MISAEFSFYADQWKKCEGQTDFHILHLAVLRGLSRSIHAEQSRFLAAGLKEKVVEMEKSELLVESLRTKKSFEGELIDVLTDATPGKSKKAPLNLSAELLNIFEAEQLDRPDRLWEATIATHAQQLGWSFWICTTTVDSAQAEDWNLALSNALWPNGVVLFTENGEIDSGDPAAQFKWTGKWYIALARGVSDPAAITQNIQLHVYQAPTWTRLDPKPS